MADPAAHRERFTEGRLLVPLVTLAVPLVGTSLFQVVYQLTDTFWVGRLGQDAVSALSYAWPLLFLSISIAGGMTMAGTILVSQHTGAGNDERVGFVAGQTIALLTLLGLGCSLIGVAFAPWLLSLLGATPGTAVHRMAVAYTRTIFLGTVFLFVFFAFQALLRGYGDARTPLYLVGASVGLNVLLDPIFVLGFDANPLFAWLGAVPGIDGAGLQAWLYGWTGFTGWGVQGAAIATVVARAAATVVALGLLFGGRVGIHCRLADLRPALGTFRRIVALGAPVSVEQSTNAVAVTVLTALLAIVGDDVVAAYGIGNRFLTLIWLPAIGLGRAVDTVVGQNLGAEQPGRARRTVHLALVIVATILLAAGGLVVWFAEPIVAAFVEGENADAVVGHGATFLRIVGPTFAFMGCYHVINGAFHGAGSTRLSMLVGAFALWGMRAAIGAMLVLGFAMGAVGAWYAIAASHVVAAAVAGSCFLVVAWDRNVLAEQRATAAD